MIEQAIKKVVEGRDLYFEEAQAVMSEFMEGSASEAQIAALLIALRMKGETVDEIAGMAQVMREKSNQVQVDFPVFDCCGTGGDGAHTFNVSTAVALLLAAGGVKVAKHGNRSVSSKSGSADVLEALGIKIDADPLEAKDMLTKHNFAFMFAPLYHPAMKHVMPVRKTLGMRTVFNILGPLTNPASATRQLLGVFDPELTEPLALVLQKLGAEHVMVVHGSGLDEIALHDSTQVSELKDGKVSTYTIHPEDFGFDRCDLEELRGGEAKRNAATLRAIFDGSEQGAIFDMVLLNAAAGFVICGQANTMPEGVSLARKIVESKKALAFLDLIAR